MIESTILLIFQEDAADGEICNSCGKEIKGIKFIPMVQVGGPMTATPLNCSWCILCKNKWDSLVETGTKRGQNDINTGHI